MGTGQNLLALFHEKSFVRVLVIDQTFREYLRMFKRSFDRYSLNRKMWIHLENKLGQGYHVNTVKTAH